MGTDEGVVVAGVGDDDVGIGGLGGGSDELLFEGFDAYAIFGLKSLGLVLDADDSLVVVGGDVGVGHTRLCHHQDDTGTPGSGYGALDAEVLYLVVSMTDACGVYKSEGDAAEQDGVFDGIASGALYIGDDSPFFG